jgi:hypothetical protein
MYPPRKWHPLLRTFRAIFAMATTTTKAHGLIIPVIVAVQ